MLSRTRKQIKNMQSFYKEAGLNEQIENMYDKNCTTEAPSKKNRPMIRKKAKQDFAAKLEAKITSDKVQTDVSEDLQKQSSNSLSIPNILVKSSTQSTLPLEKMVNKISILQVHELKTVNGCYGHTTVIFRRPIVEGQYYLEFKMNKTILNETKAKIKYPPSIRVGICCPEYSKNTPLGVDSSIGYKGSNGKFVTKSIEHQGGQQINQGDVIGLKISFSPPYKYMDENELWQDSFMVVTKNGKQMARYDKIYQRFYCPAFSLYNYASLEVRWDQNHFQYCPQGFKPYGCIFNQQILYQHLKNTAQFAFLKHEEIK